MPEENGADEGIAEQGAIDEEQEELSDLPFSMPLKIVAFCWAHVTSKVLQGDLTNATLPRVATRERLPASTLLASPLKLLVVSSLHEFLVFSLPPSWQMVTHAKLRDMDGVLKNLINTPFPVNLFEKKKITCEVSFLLSLLVCMFAALF